MSFIYIDSACYSIGSGVWLQQHNTYIQVEEEKNIPLTENRIVICISSKRSTHSANWYFLGEVNIGEGTLVNDTIERDNTRGFLKLTIPTSIPNNRLGYYYCSIKIGKDSSGNQYARHTIRISSTRTSTLPTTSYITTSKKTTTTKSLITTTPLITQTTVPSTTTTTLNSIPSIQIQLSYTPDYDTVFIGVDDVIVTCVAMTENNLQLNVSLFDMNNGNLLKKETDNDGRLEIDERIELMKGNLTYKCIAVTEIGSVEAFISIRAESELLENDCNVSLFSGLIDRYRKNEHHYTSIHSIVY